MTGFYHIRHIVRKCLAILSLSIILFSCSHGYVEDSRFALDTVVTLRLEKEEYIDKAFSDLGDAEKKISAFIDDSEIHRINSNAGIAPVTVSEEVFSLIELALELEKETDGFFSPLLGPLTMLWNIGRENQRVPEEEEIERALELIDSDCCILDRDRRTVFLARSGMALDLGGIGKGYVSDAIVESLRKEGASSGLINLGGNVYAMGRKEGGGKWKIGITDPGSARSECFDTIEAEDEAVSTSGPYQRFFEEDGRIYHHILDSRTGYPVESDIISATVIAPLSAYSDAYATALYAMGLERALDFARSKGLKAVLLTRSGEEYRVNI